MNDSIRVYHRDDLEDIIVIETVILLFGLNDSLQQILYYTLNDIAGCSFHWMLSADNPDDLAL